MAQTGFGADISFGTQSFDPTVISITPGAESVPDVETSTMETANGYETFIAGDLIDGGEITCVCDLDPDDDPTIGGANETITLTFPVAAGNSTGATYAFSGYIKSWQVGNIAKNERMLGTFVVKVGGNITRTNGS